MAIASKMLPIIHFSFDIFMSFYNQFLNTNGCWINYFFHLPWKVFVYKNKIFQKNKYLSFCTLPNSVCNLRWNKLHKKNIWKLYFILFSVLDYLFSDIFLPVESCLNSITVILIICIKLWLFNHAVFNFFKPRQGKKNVFFFSHSLKISWNKIPA